MFRPGASTSLLLFTLQALISPVSSCIQKLHSAKVRNLPNKVPAIVRLRLTPYPVLLYVMKSAADTTTLRLNLLYC